MKDNFFNFLLSFVFWKSKEIRERFLSFKMKQEDMFSPFSHLQLERNQNKIFLFFFLMKITFYFKNFKIITFEKAKTKQEKHIFISHSKCSQIKGLKCNMYKIQQFNLYNNII